MLCTGHADLRDVYGRRAMALDLAILALTTWLAAISFVSPQIGVSLTPFHFDPQVWVGLLSIATLFLAILQLKTDWKGRSDAHKRSLETYAEVKREAGYVLAKEDMTERDFIGVIERNNMASAVAIEIPEARFIRLKQKHLIKVAVSKFLDDNPGASLLILRLRLWKRGTFTKEMPE